MSVSGLVLTLDRAVALYPSTLAALHAHARVTVGSLQGCKIAIVVEARCAADEQVMWSWLHALSGVAEVAVAYVGYDHAPTTHANTSPISSQTLESSTCD